MDSCIRALMNLPIGWRKYVSQDVNGQKSYDAVSTVMCYKKNGLEMRRTTTGEELLSRECYYIDGTTVTGGLITNNDRIVGLEGHDFPIIDVVPFYDGKGNLDIVEVYV